MDGPSHRKLVTATDEVGPRVGDAAPNFHLRRTFDESIALKDLTSRGPVLLLFYVFDFGEV